MVMTATPTYALFNTPDGATPIYTLTFGAIQSDTISTVYATGPIRGQAVSALIAQRPSIADRSITPLEGTSSVGQVDIELMDADGAIQTLLSQHQMEQRDATLCLMYAGMPYADRMTRFVGQVTDVNQGSEGCSFIFSITDRLDRLGVDILKPEDLALEYQTGSAKTWSQDTSIAGYASLVLSDSDDDGYYDRAVVTGHPANIALCFMMSGSGDGSYSGEDFDVFPAWAGASIPVGLIDAAKWIDFRDRQQPMVAMRFTLSDKERLQSFIEQEICRVLGGYLIVSGDGRIGCRFFEAPRTTGDLTAFDDTNIVGRPVQHGNKFDYVSHLVLSFDHDGEAFGTEAWTRMSPSWAAGLRQIPREHVIESRGLQTDLGGQVTAAIIASNLFRRYDNPPPRVEWTSFFFKNLVEPGDIVRLKSSLYPNVDSLGVNTDRLVEVISARVEPDGVKFSGLDMSLPLAGGEHIALIAENGLPDFEDATDDQKQENAFLADAATGLMPDGSAPYIFA